MSTSTNKSLHNGHPVPMPASLYIMTLTDWYGQIYCSTFQTRCATVPILLCLTPISLTPVRILGKVRLAKWFTTLSPKDKAKIIKDVSQLVLARRTRMCNFLEYKGVPAWSPTFQRIKSACTYAPDLTSPDSPFSSLTLPFHHPDTKVVYRRYASLFFIAATDPTDNELITLEIVHRYVEQMDKYYGNVCELDIIFNFQKAYFILDELLLAGELQESSKKNVLRVIGAQDSLEDMEVSADDSYTGSHV
jgi:AP-1 complex subunit sigma 1/2